MYLSAAVVVSFSGFYTNDFRMQVSLILSEQDVCAVSDLIKIL